LTIIKQETKKYVSRIVIIIKKKEKNQQKTDFVLKLDEELQ